MRYRSARRRHTSITDVASSRISAHSCLGSEGGMRILMLVANSVRSDVRVWREATTLCAAGHTVTIIGRDVPPGGDDAPGIEVLSASGGSGLRGATTGVGQPSTGRTLTRAARWLLLPEHRALVFARWSRSAVEVARRVPFDAVHAHDFPALEVGATLARERRVALVYDTHEWWSQRRQVGRPNPLRHRREHAVEKQLGHEAAAVITVGDGLAARLREQFGWRDIRVVRNTFPDDRSDHGIPRQPSAVLYAGRLASGRDLETAARASHTTGLPIRLMGPMDRSWLQRFDQGACSVEMPVEIDQVDAELRRAGLALVTLSADCGNHREALPNKVFQAVRNRVPVVASEVGALSRLVARHNLGTLYRPGRPDSLTRAIGAAQDRYQELTASIERAASALSWSSDGETLVTLYDQLERARC